MPHPATCPSCGTPLPPDSPQGLCRACLLKRGLESNTVGFTEPQAPAKNHWQPPSPEQLAPLFPELQISRLLGRGGMGAVYLARQIALDRTVALKILPPDLGQDPAFSERFTREAQALARLNHPHIVTIHDFGTRTPDSLTSSFPPSLTSSPLYFFLMEFVDGTNLRALLDAGHIAPKEALAIVPQICDALQYAHDHGIVHRDIKPENILLNKQGQVKIADFGLAKLIGKTTPQEATGEGASSLMTHPSSLITQPAGTPAYMAPEQFAHPSDVDHRADIYSLGVVFYQLLTGQLPALPLEPPSAKVHIDVRLDQIVLRALEQSPELRFQNATQFKTEVETVIATPPPPPAAPSTSETGIPQPPPLSEIPNPNSEVHPAHPLAPARLPLVVLHHGKRRIHWNNLSLFTAAAMTIAGLAAFAMYALFSALNHEWLPDPARYLVFPPIFTLSLLLATLLFKQFRKPLDQLPSLDRSECRSSATIPAPSPSEISNLKSEIPHPVPNLNYKSPPARFSRTAILGAFWSAFFFAVVPAFIVYEFRTHEFWRSGPFGQPPRLFQICVFFGIIVPAFMAPIATTILGIIALGQIRHSAGRLYGLGMALFDSLLFPLLGINIGVRGCVVYLGQYFVRRWFEHEPRLAWADYEAASWTISLILILALDILLARWAWKAACKPLATAPAVASLL